MKWAAFMSDDQKKNDFEITNRHEREKLSRKPAPLPVRSAPDIFASSEATHLLEKGEETSLLNTIEDSEVPGPKAFTEEPQRTQILKVDSASTTVETTRKAPVTSDSNQGVQVDVTPDLHASTTQLLDVPTQDPNALFDSSESTKALTGMFEDNDEKTAFFHTQDERAEPKPPPGESRRPDPLVDPTPRRTLNQRQSSSGVERSPPPSQAPSPLPRRSNSTKKASAPSAEPEASAIKGGPRIEPKKKPSRESVQSKGRRRQSKQHQNEEAPKAEPLNVGVFAEDASVVLDDVINQVVEESWQTVPAQTANASNTTVRTRSSKKGSRTKTLWLRIGVGFIVLVAVGFMLRSEPSSTIKDDVKRSSNVATPLIEQVLTLGLGLPLSDSARKLRPGTDVFLLGRQRLLLIIDGVDQSQLIHTDSLARTLKNSLNLAAVEQQLSGIKAWPEEISIGLDRSTPISETLRLCQVLANLGVQRINLLTDSQALGGVGELGIDVAMKAGSIPAVGALEMKVGSAVISITLVTPKSPAKPLQSLDAFTPDLHKKLDEHVETFTFEHPRIVRAFLRVPEGLRLSQVVELARPLVRDERMRRITILPYEPVPGAQR